MIWRSSFGTPGKPVFKMYTAEKSVKSMVDKREKGKILPFLYAIKRKERK